MEIIYTLNSLDDVVLQLWQQFSYQKVWALHGEMGVGKTTFVHALGQALQVTDVISSPTFAIINEYSSPVAGTMYHMDWYRLKDEEEAIQAGIEDSLLSGIFCLIEWPGMALGLLPDDTLHIYIETLDENTRRLHTEAADAI